MILAGTSRVSSESVVGNYGSGTPNENSQRMLSFCCARNLAVVGSWFKRKNIHRTTWISNDGHTMKEIDHIITRDRWLFRSCSFSLMMNVHPIPIISWLWVWCNLLFAKRQHSDTCETRHILMLIWTTIKNISLLRVLVYTVHQRHLRRCAI